MLMTASKMMRRVDESTSLKFRKKKHRNLQVRMCHLENITLEEIWTRYRFDSLTDLF